VIYILQIAEKAARFDAHGFLSVYYKARNASTGIAYTTIYNNKSGILRVLIVSINAFLQTD
jgi:hypothetical protein